MMHLVATNLIIWIHGIVKESVEEIIVHEKELQEESIAEYSIGMVLFPP